MSNVKTKEKCAFACPNFEEEEEEDWIQPVLSDQWLTQQIKTEKIESQERKEDETIYLANTKRMQYQACNFFTG